MANESIEPLQSPFCGSLRSKKYFMLDRLATSADEYLDATNHVWCRETQEVIGPDNASVDPERCGPGRPCYTSALKSV
ncbi:MAG TPA: hypothetical protein VFT26_15125 [Pyrinomonadaceae bacterium]|nr:hypothetical protein [Pyrinomonadaceae bacterium]